jgi:hypothetical protein
MASNPKSRPSRHTSPPLTWVKSGCGPARHRQCPRARPVHDCRIHHRTRRVDRSLRRLAHRRVEDCSCTRPAPKQGSRTPAAEIFECSLVKDRPTQGFGDIRCAKPVSTDYPRAQPEEALICSSSRNREAMSGTQRLCRPNGCAKVTVFKGHGLACMQEMQEHFAARLRGNDENRA